MQDEATKMPERSSGREITPSLTEALKAQRNKAEAELAELNETIKLIESQPEIQKVLDALSRLGKLKRF
ncbi:unnamed protein product [marine sediment metagenome]|uniref:Uncharacterized protein n=1 Tax=marine sediment metagenome TaxID=412755 RepID=X0YGK7_9ZZZZ